MNIGSTPDELSFIYERAIEGLKVYPSFATIATFTSLPNPDIRVEISRYIHGEQLIRIHAFLKKKDKINRVGVITKIYDKGKGAVVHSLVTGHNMKGNHLFDTKWIHFYLGGGEFGGERGPEPEVIMPPEGKEPDFSISFKTHENQAALYWLKGNLNQIHIDKKFVIRAGQKKPFLHGLCTYRFAIRAIIQGACEEELNRSKEFKARFSEVVFLGEILTIEGWKVNNRKYIIQAKTKRVPVLTNAYALID